MGNKQQQEQTNRVGAGGGKGSIEKKERVNVAKFLDLVNAIGELILI